MNLAFVIFALFLLQISEVDSSSDDSDSSGSSASSSNAPRRRRAARKGDAMREKMLEYDKLMKEAIDDDEFDEEIEEERTQNVKSKNRWFICREVDRGVPYIRFNWPTYDWSLFSTHSKVVKITGSCRSFLPAFSLSR